MRSINSVHNIRGSMPRIIDMSNAYTWENVMPIFHSITQFPLTLSFSLEDYSIRKCSFREVMNVHRPISMLYKKHSKEPMFWHTLEMINETIWEKELLHLCAMHRSLGCKPKNPSWCYDHLSFFFPFSCMCCEMYCSTKYYPETKRSS